MSHQPFASAPAVRFGEFDGFDWLVSWQESKWMEFWKKKNYSVQETKLMEAKSQWTSTSIVYFCLPPSGETSAEPLLAYPRSAKKERQGKRAAREKPFNYAERMQSKMEAKGNSDTFPLLPGGSSIIHSIMERDDGV